jgi:uncharacterized membrane protein
MATLSVLKFDDPYGAERVMIALQGMQEREMITLEDAAVVSWPQGNRKPTTRQLHSTAGAGWGAFWGFLFGLIFFVPFLGAAIGAGMGGMTGALADVGISDDFIKEVREKVTEGTSALFALTSGATAVDKVAQSVRLRDHLDQPARGSGAETTRGLRARRVVQIAEEQSTESPLLGARLASWEQISPRVPGSGYPLKDMPLWGMTSPLAGAYAPGASRRVEASENLRRRSRG